MSNASHSSHARFLSFSTGLVLMLLFGLGLPIVGSLLSNTLYSDWRWSDPAFHTFIEFLGGVLAIGLGAMLLNHEETRAKSLYFWIGCGLVGMGVLDGFHAFVSPGKTFVWFHSTAVFVGGILFLLGSFFNHASPFRHRLALPVGIGLGVMVFGFGSLEMPALIPTMVQEGEFTLLAKGLNVVGGLGCIAAALRFIVEFRQSGRVDEWLFAIHCLLFGAAGILFEISTLWDAGWWWWHALRLVAYGTGFQCVMTLSQRRMESGSRIETTSSDDKATSSIPQKKNLTAWLPLLIVAMVLVIIGIGAGATLVVQEHLLKREGDRLAMMARNIADQLHQNLFERRSDVQLLAKAEVFWQSDVDAMNAHLSQVAETYQAFFGLSFVNVDGVVIASNNPQLLGQDFGGELSWPKGQERLTFDLQDVRPNPFLANSLTLTLSNPVFGPENQLIGAVVGYVRVDRLRRIFEASVEHLLALQGAGTDFEWQLLSQNGTVILENVLSHEGQANLRDILVPSAWMLTSDRAGYVEEVHIRRQIPVLTGYAKMESIPEVPGFHWGILVRRDKDNLLADMQDTEIKLGLVGVAMTFPLVGLLLLIVRRLETSQNIATQALAVAEINETQLVQMAKTNKDLADRNALILESAAEGIYGLDLNGVTTFVNPAGARMLGYEPRELIGLPMHAKVHHTKGDGSAYPREDCPMYAAVKDGSVHHIDNEVLWRKDGTSFPVEYSSTPQRNSLGEVIGAVVTYRDVTERKKMEAELVDAMILTQGIVDTAADGIITIDEEGKIESFNKAAWDIFGYEEQEVLGQNVSMLMPSPYQEEHDGYLRSYRQTGEKKIIGSGREVLGRRKDGTVFPLDLSVSEVKMGSRRVFTGIVRNISERKQAEADLVEARDQAIEAVRLKSEFLAIMSHEIRTPMNGVLGMNGLLMETDLTQEQREYAETVKHSADALLTIINDILDFSKIESGKLDIEIIDFDLRVAIEEVLDLIGARAQEKGLELIGLVYASVPTAVRGDPGRFRQILLNLVGNAIKFTAQGEVVIQVIPQEETDHEVFLRVEVKDTGIGISLEVQARLFQPFSQADGSTTRKYGGTGLGLAICKQLAELMHGTIGVDSLPGHGSCFWFTVRMEKQTEPSNRPADPSASLNGLRVCVVDDNDTNRLLLHHFANNWGMTCLSAENGKVGLELLKDAVAKGEPCDLLIIDMQMPGMDGFTMARLVKADSALKDIKIVMVTSLGRRGDAGLAQEIGIAGYLTKPLRQNQLRDCLLLVVNGSATGEIQVVTKYTIRETERRKEGRLLVADDNIVNQKVAVKMLEKLGYRVDVVANGLEAVEAVSRIAYHLVFMDCQMPEMDGYEATREIRKREGEMGKSMGVPISPAMSDERQAGTHLPIIAMTANAMPGDRDKCLESGMDDFISKPVKKEALEALLDQWVPNKEIESEEVSPSDQNVSSEMPKMRDTTDTSRVMSPEHLTTNDEAQGPPIDSCTIEGLRELSGDDPSFLIEVIQQFLHDGPDHLSAIQQAVIEGDADALMKAAHGFKGSCRNMGALPLGELCCSLEQKGREGDIEYVRAVFQDVKHEYARVQEALEVELEKLIPLPAS